MKRIYIIQYARIQDKEKNWILDRAYENREEAYKAVDDFNQEEAESKCPYWIFQIEELPVF